MGPLRCICLLLTSVACISHAAEIKFCTRGKSFEPGQEFLQTRQLIVRVNQSAPEDVLLMIASRAVQKKIWITLKPDQVQVVPFDVSLCGGEPAAELSITINDDDLTAITEERGRGPADQPRTLSIAGQSTGKVAPAKPSAGDSNSITGNKRYDLFRLYFATSRKTTGKPHSTEAFSTQPSDNVSFGAVDVSIPADHRWANLESPSVLRFEVSNDPSRHISISPTYESLNITSWRKLLNDKASGFDKPGVLLFVHGYNNNFKEAALRAAQLSYDLSFAGPTVLFSWPSDGDALSYTRDEEKVKSAWRRMAEVLRELTTLSPGVKVYVVAHSMGNRVLAQGMAELLRKYPGDDSAFSQVILASPDIGRGEFRELWKNDLRTANLPRFTMYASAQDIPVSLSAWLHGEPRLGSGGSGIAVLPGLDSVDASRITKEWFGLSHSYFGDNETVLSDLFQVIHNGPPPDDRPRLQQIRSGDERYWEFKP